MSTVQNPLEEVARPDRFFVTIKLSGRQRPRDLADFDLDLHATHAEPDGAGVDGLLSLDEVAEVVRAGYPVLVASNAEERAAARNVIEFDDWLHAQRQDLGQLGER